MRTLPAVITFEGSDLSVIDHDGRPWLTSSDVSRALGYTRRDAAQQIFARNECEFTPGMSLTLNLRVKGRSKTIRPTRVFSPRGCHLIAMFARTERAQAFRRWVLDVLENLAVAPATPPALPAPADDEGAKAPRKAINRRAYAMTLQQYDTIRQQIVEALDKWGQGKSLDDQVRMVDTLDIPGGSLVIVHESLLWPVTQYANVAALAHRHAVEAIHRMEEATERHWYARPREGVDVCAQK